MADDRGARVLSACGAVAEEELLARRLPLPGTFNVRDVGGYCTADGRIVVWWRLLRGDALSLLEDEGRKVLQSIGLRTVLDLREADERAAAPDRLDPAVQQISIPFFTYVPQGLLADEVAPIDHHQINSLDETYRLLIHQRGPVLLYAIRKLLEPGALPAIVHCALGKDRTGVLIGLVLSAVGVPDEVVAADFGATALFLTEELKAGAARRNEAVSGDPARLAAVLRCEPELMLGLLTEIRSVYGDVPAYLAQFGFRADELARLRSLLLDPDSKLDAHGARITTALDEQVGQR